MKIKYLLILFIVLMQLNASASEEIFSKAEKAYRSGNYDEAVKLYESALGENEISPAVFYNLGNCHFKKSDFVRALLWYERAAKYDPGNEDIKMNLEITRSKISEENENVSSGVSGWFYTIVNSRPADYWSWLCIFLSLAGSAFLFLMFLSTQISMKRISLATAFISFSFSVVFFIFSWYQTAYFNTNEQAIVMSENAEVRSEPIGNSKAVFTFPAGMKVKILQEKGEWSEIIFNSNVGWVKSEEIERI